MKTICQELITTIGFRSSEIRIEVSEVIVRIKTSHQGITTLGWI